MKSIYKTLSLTIVFIGLSFILKAQTVAKAWASATVITPVTIEKISDLNFGNLSVPISAGGRVILNTSGYRLNTGGVTLPFLTGNVSQAAFTITGSGIDSYEISLPSAVTLTRSNGRETVTANAFTSSPYRNSSTNSGMQKLSIGGTLTVGAAQAPGLYISSDFNVTVNYN